MQAPRPRPHLITLLQGISLMLVILRGAVTAQAGCDNIPSAVDLFRGAEGAITAPYAIPGQRLQVRVRPTVCDSTSPGFGTPPACLDASELRVTVIFTPGDGAPVNAVVLGLTDHVDDENPLWAMLDADGHIRQLGGSRGTHVTAGLYWLPAQRPAEPAGNFGRLRDYLGWLVARHPPVRGIVLPRVFDIDRARDIAAAEAAEFGLKREMAGCA